MLTGGGRSAEGCARLAIDPGGKGWPKGAALQAVRVRDRYELRREPAANLQRPALTALAAGCRLTAGEQVQAALTDAL